MNLGIAFRECAADEGSDSRDRAIEAFEEALSVWTRNSKPMAWAAARMQLGGAYLENFAGVICLSVIWVFVKPHLKSRRADVFNRRYVRAQATGYPVPPTT